MNVDVDAWAIDCREKIACIYKKRGEIVPGAFVLATTDPVSGEELPTPQTWTQFFYEYDSLSDFEEALRIQCMRTRALAAVIFSPAMRMALGFPVYEVISCTYERRGRTKPMKWTARVVAERELEEFIDSSTVQQQNAVSGILPPVN